MGRKNKSVNRPILPDSRYNSSVVSKFVTRMMLDGKKSISVRIMYEAMDTLKSKTEKDPLEVFLKALDNVKPLVEVKSRRVGGYCRRTCKKRTRYGRAPCCRAFGRIQ